MMDRNTTKTYWAVRNRGLARQAENVAAEVAEAGDELSYRDLQARAKALGLPASGSREELEAAIAEAGSTETEEAGEA